MVEAVAGDFVTFGDGSTNQVLLFACHVREKEEGRAGLVAGQDLKEGFDVAPNA